MDEPLELPPVPDAAPQEPAPRLIHFATEAADQAPVDIALPSVPDSHVPYARAMPPAFAHARSDSRTPGLVTAIGVLAIVVGCLSGLVSVVGGGETFAVFMVSKFMGRVATASATVSAQPLKTLATEPLSVADSGVVTAVLQEQLELDGARLRELTEILLKHGTAIFQISDNVTLTPAGVRDAVTESHKATADDSSAALFTTSAGTVEIYVDHASFKSVDGSATIRTSAKDQSDNVTTSPPATTEPTSMPGSALQPGEISRALASIRQWPGVKVTPAQMASIRREISASDQTLIAGGGTTPVYFATNLPTNELQITFNSGTLTLDPAGKVTASVSTFNANPMNSTFSIPGSWAAVVVSECALSALLAIYLFVVGIVTLRGSLSSPRLLRIYAYLKMILAVVTIVGVGQLISGSDFGNAGASRTGNQFGGYLFGAGLFAAGVAYPIGVLIALRAAAVRRYFAAEEAERF